MKQLPEITGTNELAQTNIFRIEQVNLKFSNGESRVYERCHSQGADNGAVMVVPVTHENNLLLVREYAVGLEAYALNFPKGVIDAGEQAPQAALRELQEEVGVHANNVVFLKKVTTSPSYLVNQLHIYLARELSPSRLVGDEPEPLEVVEWPLADYQTLLMRNDFSGALSLSALLLAQQYLDV